MILAPLLFYTLLNAGDFVSTEIALHHGAAELNPLGQFPEGRITLKVTSILAFTLADVGFQQIEETGSPSQRHAAHLGKWILRGGAFLLYSIVTYHNLHISHGAGG